MNRKELFEHWKHEEQKPFTGWDFSYLDGRMLEERPPWSYSLRAAELMRQSASVVDLDTGGGERFLLSDDNPMPFSDAEFDLVSNRHAAFNPNEVARVLTPGGTFLTQQVHGLWAVDLLVPFGAKPQWPEATPEKDLPRLKSAGLTIVDAQEWAGKLTFTEVGAIVYYLKAVPWLVPGFTVESHLEYLLRLQNRLEDGGGLTFEARKYLIEARKTAQSSTIDSNRRS